ncbi:DUF7175 family protein [Pantoea eucrina]|uniref:DUF7175 family protein n=1 Tax=Pantoea eucrina TaxID=472693 RepID=UPI00080F4E48|nr:hypothetical protein [Pantoea eucrina]
MEPLTSLIVVTHQSKGKDALLYAIISRQHEIRISILRTWRALLRTKRWRQAKELHAKLAKRLEHYLNEIFPGSIDCEIKLLEYWDTEGDVKYPRYRIKVEYPFPELTV